MDIRQLSPAYSVSPQITALDLPEIRAAGFATLICNRPDPEIPPSVQAQAIRRAAEAEGLTFVENAVLPGGLTPDVLRNQAEAIASASGPVLAYCASGNRSAIVWGLLQAPEMGVDAVLSATSAVGYDHGPMRPMFEAASRKG